MNKNEVSLSPLKKAAKSLEKALMQQKNEYVRDAVIQRFEYTFELGWKMLMRYFKVEEGIREYNIKELFREAGKQSLIDSVEDWFEYHKGRNLTTHAYNEKVAEETYEIAQRFSPAINKLILELEKKLGTN